MIDVQGLFEYGDKLRRENELDSAWSVFSQTLHLVDLLNKSDDSFDLHKLKFQLLSEIGKIQQEKNLLEAADATFISAEALRTKFLAETDIPPIEHVGLLKWQQDYNTLEEFFAEDQYYAVLAMAKTTADEIEKLGDSAMTRNHRRLLMKLYDMIYRAYEAVDEPVQAAIYDEKAEDISFIHGFDRFA
ncbi:MAG: hypothetical protein PHI69_06285 [Eubacteriales bacterium]|jgi:hypothetical protein|nr:hypothetical protein [Eubacteriales bacterium]